MVINLKSQTELSGFYIIYYGSTLLEKRGIYGISHLMEHLMCKTFEHLREDFEREGIDWNAYTSTNEIVFYFTGLDKNLQKRKNEIIKCMSDFDINKSQFENERNIVLEEYTDYFSDQTESHMLNLTRKIYNIYDPIGLREDLESMKFMDCLNFYEKQFSQPSKIINVSSTTPFEYNGLFNKLTFDKQIKFDNYEDAILEKTNDFGDKVSFILSSPIAQDDFNYITFINAMLSTGLSSPLYKEIREKRGLVYYIRCNQTRFNKQGVTHITTQTNLKNVERLNDSIKMILKNPTKYLTKERFDTIKNSYLIKLKKDKINRYSNVSRWINPKGWSIKEIIDTINLDKIMSVYAKYYDFDKFNLSTDKEEFSK